MKQQNLNQEIIFFSDEVSELNNEQYNNFLIIVKFILLNVIKIYLGIEIKNKLNKTIYSKISKLSQFILPKSCFNIVNYIIDKEKDLFTFNLDKKIFTTNLFSYLIKN